MINHNLLLYSLLDRKFSIEHNGKASVVNYTEGDLYELAAKLNDQSSANQLKYPMIWLQSGYNVQRDKIKRTTKLSGCRFFFIINGDAVMRYEQRYAGNFNAFLYKSMLRFDETIENRSGISANVVDEFKSFPLNNVAELGKGGDKKIPVQDIWDAVEFTTDMEIENECFPEFKINI